VVTVPREPGGTASTQGTVKSVVRGVLKKLRQGQELSGTVRVSANKNDVKGETRETGTQKRTAARKEKKQKR